MSDSVTKIQQFYQQTVSRLLHEAGNKQGNTLEKELTKALSNSLIAARFVLFTVDREWTILSENTAELYLPLLRFPEDLNEILQPGPVKLNGFDYAFPVFVEENIRGFLLLGGIYNNGEEIACARLDAIRDFLGIWRLSLSQASGSSFTRTQVLERLLTVKQLQINSLLEVSQAINNNFSTSALFRIYEFILRAQLGVQSLLVFIRNPTWICVCKTGISQEHLDRFNVEEVLGQFSQTAKIKDEDKNLLPGSFDVVIPVCHKETALAFVLVGNLRQDPHDSIEEKIKFIQTISNIIIVAIENKKLFNSLVQKEIFEWELKLGAQMQALLIPQNLPSNDKIDMAAVYLPHQDIGGDYYDYIWLNEDEIALCIGDISGKGIAAALLMANFQANIRALVKEGKPLDSLMQELNTRVNEITKGEKFITLFLGIYNFSERKLRFVNAGHNPPYLKLKESLIPLTNGCTLLGMFDELPEVEVGEIIIPPGSMLFNYTDGLVDLENDTGDYFETERLENFLLSSQEQNMESLNQKLLSTIDNFKETRRFVDDITILTCYFR